MRTFDMISWAAEHYRAQAYDISNYYFTVDTAEPEDVYNWVNYNRLMVTYALNNDRVEGFFTILPLTKEAGKLFENNQIKEEEITIEHLLSPDVMHYAEYLYCTAIAVRNYQSYAAHQCVAALVSAMSTHLFAMYDVTKLKKMFVNPTTFQGNRMVHKLGLEPVSRFKRPLTESDFYVSEFNDATIERLKRLEERYKRFVGKNCWHDQEWINSKIKV